MKIPSLQPHHHKLSAFFHEVMLLEQGSLSERAMGEALLGLLSNIFGYNESGIWMRRPGEHAFWLAAHLVNDVMIEKYNKEFYKLDPLNPSNIISEFDTLENKNVVTIKDIMTNPEFHETEYYRNFLCKENYCDEAVMYLRHQEEIIGCVGILRRKADGEFTSEDVHLMSVLSFYLAELTEKYFSASSIMKEKNLFQSLSDQSPTGIIVFKADSPYTVQYINNAAFRYMAEFSSPYDVKMHGEKFIRQYILHDSSYKEFGVSKKILSYTNKPYFVNAVPSQATDSNASTIYVYVIPQSGSKTEKKGLSLEDNPNLTDRQLEVIHCVLLGKSNEEIAKELFISVSTVKTHLNNIYKELNVANRLSLYSKLIEH